MRFNKLDLNQLVVLDALLNEKSVKRAAEKVFLSPAATSCALARLRDYFEDELLHQLGKTMVLTAKAESLQRPVRDVLLQIQSITTSNPSFDPKTSTRKITIEASDYVMVVYLADLLRRAWVEAPGMQFDLRVVGTQSHSDLDSGEVDMLIVPEFFTAPGHPSERLFTDTWSCVVWDGNTDIGARLSLKQYLAMGHVGIEWGAGRLLTHDETVATRLGYSRRREVTAPNFTVVPHFLVGTSRVATLQTQLARKLVANSPLRILPCPLPIEPLFEAVQCHKYQELDPAVVWLRELMRQEAAKIGHEHQPAARPVRRRVAA
ncbi:MAG: LysR family transcriptional regulator [Pseudomonadota bacterium]